MLELRDGLYANVPHHAAEMLQQRMPGAVQQREAVLHGHTGQRMPGMRDADPAERRSRALASMRKRGSLCSHEEKHRSAGTSAGQRDRIGQSAGADHALLLDRASISRQNGYVEPDGTIRLYFTLEQAQTKLHRSRQSATRIFRELEYSGLIVRRKQGLGKPALITLNYPSDAKLIAKEGEDAQA